MEIRDRDTSATPEELTPNDIEQGQVFEWWDGACGPILRTDEGWVYIDDGEVAGSPEDAMDDPVRRVPGYYQRT